MLNQQEFDSKRADRVNAILAEADRFGIKTTRRQGRKTLSGRGGLMDKIRAARVEREAAENGGKW